MLLAPVAQWCSPLARTLTNAQKDSSSARLETNVHFARVDLAGPDRSRKVMLRGFGRILLGAIRHHPICGFSGCRVAGRIIFSVVGIQGKQRKNVKKKELLSRGNMFVYVGMFVENRHAPANGPIPLPAELQRDSSAAGAVFTLSRPDAEGPGGKSGISANSPCIDRPIAPSPIEIPFFV
jgi:hypothetical protein